MSTKLINIEGRGSSAEYEILGKSVFVVRVDVDTVKAYKA